MQKIKHFGEYVGKQKIQLVDIQLIGFFFCDLVRIQTLNLQSRNLVLYSVELRGLFFGLVAKRLSVVTKVKAEATGP